MNASRVAGGRSITSDEGLFSELAERARRGRVVWVGRKAPVGMETLAAPLDADADYRAPTNMHQQAAVVCLLEADLGRIKAWPLVLDECLRLLAPGGLLVVRFSNTALASVFAFKHQLARWPGAPVMYCEYTRSDRSIVVGVELVAEGARASTLTGVSFGVITTATDTAALAPFLDSVQQLTPVDGIAVEALVCGPACLSAPLAMHYPSVVHVSEPTAFGALGWITRKKNLLVDRASQSFTVVAHDRYRFRADFLTALVEFGGDVDLLIPRQERPDGRRYPDWVALGTAWSWSSPGMLAYGDWSPHLYINGGITAGRTEVLRSLRWNELLFWGQGEDVELSRRALASGLVPRFARRAVAISSSMRAGTMEAFAALPISAEHFYSGGPKYADGVHEVPTLPLGRPVMLQGPAALSRATRDGFSFDGPWTIAAQGLALAPGQFGEIAGQLDRDSADRIVLRLEFASPVETLELLINDAPAPDIAPSCGTFAVWEGPIQAGVLSGSVAFRVHLRSAQPVVLHAMELSLAQPAPARPVRSGAVAALARRTRQPWGLAEDRLCVADSPLVVRGAQRLAIFLPDEPKAVAALQPFLQALRAVVRPDAHVTLVGARRLHGPLPGFTFFPADWSRLRRDGAYLRQRSQAFQRLDAQVIVNALHPRLLEVDLLLVEHRACLVVGFEAEGFSATPAEVALIRATYSSLISSAADVGEALMRHFALPSSPV